MVTASTLADPYTVVSSAIGTLKGPLHGGAAQEVAEMLEEIGSLENVRPYLEQRLAAKEKLMDTPPLYELAEEVESVGEELLRAKGVHANVDFYSGVLYKTMGLDSDFFPTLFAMARVSGLVGSLA